MLVELITNYIGHFSYLGIFILLFLSSVGLPLPEEMVLFVAGYFMFFGIVTWLPTIFIALAEIILGDNLGYFIGFKRGEWFMGLIRAKKFLPTKLFVKAEKFFNVHGNKSIFLARFLVGLRFFVPIISGYFKISWKKFFIYDTLGAVIWTPLVIFISYHVGNLTAVVAGARRITHTVYWVLVVVVAFYVLLRFVASELFNGDNK